MVANLSGSPSTVKTVFCIVFLIILAPVGLFMMFRWMKWPAWIKGILTLVGIYITLIEISFISGLIVVLTNPYGQIFKAQNRQCASQCQNADNATVCMQQCLDKIRNPK
ncbi:hypothetical protein HYU96_00300 [Candidatus Daviesbacteria bacterium]|nr:hypothetical protein [Candidatus Daviesbacteria bacterium]